MIKGKTIRLNVRVVRLIVMAFMIPSMIFFVVFFSYMRKNMINSHLEAMDHLMSQQQVQINKHIEAIRITERFFLGDEELIGFLGRAARNNLTTKENYTFYNETLHTLERMVNNNPNLYQVRIYMPHKNIQEMMPVLYYEDRMEKLAWSNNEAIQGWHFDYEDTLFSSIQAHENLVSYVTLLKEPYTDLILGTMEVTMLMETMFPTLYEKNLGRWSYFISYKDNMYTKKVPQTLQKTVQDIEKKEQAYTDYVRLDGKATVIGYLPLDTLEGALVLGVDISAEMNRITYMGVLTALMIGLLVGVFILIFNEATQKIFKNFYHILYSIQEMQKGDLSQVITTEGKDEVSELGVQINKMSEQIKALMQENVHREVLVKNSEIKALQNQINAHFIYNVLESIKMMAEIDEKYEISDATTALGKLLRYSMKWTSSHVSVQEELEYIKNYLKLINLRFDYEIKLNINMQEEVYDQNLPKMSLQPIIENAIYHGIEDQAEDTTISIRGTIENACVVIEITDTGKGMDEKTLEKLYKKMNGAIESSGGTGNGIGLKNVQDRIKMSFGESYGLSIVSKEDRYTKVKVIFPVTVDKKEGSKQCTPF